MAEISYSNPDESPRGLPPVEPPSGRFIAQLFLVPGLIVCGLIAVVFSFTWLASGSKTVHGFLEGLNHSNPEIRWRTASDLAQVLPRDDKLASDPELGLKLTARLQESLETLRKPPPPKPEDVPPNERRAAAEKRRQFEIARSEMQYLAACAGGLCIPVSVPVLDEIATKPISPDPLNNAFIRRQAVWALATLGHNLTRWKNLPTERQAEVIAELKSRAARTGDEADWARIAVDYLEGDGSLGVIAALAKCADDPDPFVRQQAALALSFWHGTPDEETLAETTLLKLLRDDGRGESLRLQKDD